MIYDLSLRTAGILSGGFLLLLGAFGILLPAVARPSFTKLPRSSIAGVVLLTLAFAWSFWLLATMEMGEFAGFRRLLLIFLPIAYALVLMFVREFLAVRALGMLYLLAATPLLEAAFLRYELSRLLVTVFAYILIVKGIFWVTMPYLMRDGIAWSTRSSGRWFALHVAVLAYGVVLLFFAFTSY